MTTAIIQGATGGLGAPLTAALLQRTRLNVVALSSKTSASDIRERVLQYAGGAKDVADRLHVVPNVDVKREESIGKAAEEVKKRFGVSTRLLVCLAGVLHPEKSLGGIDAADALDSFQTNVLGHLFLHKHFVPLIPPRRDFATKAEEWGGDDPADGLITGDGSVVMSLSARVGSIGENGKGGWYSYRASKAALNQVIRTLDHELINKKSSALAIAYHPGTTLTSFTKPIIGSPKPDESKGIFEPEQAVEKMLEVIKQAKREIGGKGEVAGRGWGGTFRDWKGEQVGY